MFKNKIFNKFISLLCLGCILSASTHASLLEVCGLLIRRNIAKETKDDLRRLDLINRMDDVNEKIRARKLKPDEVEIENVMRTKLSKIDNQIYQGQYSYAHRSIRGVFRKVEINTIFIKKQQKVLDDLLPLLETKSLAEIKQHFAIKASSDPFYATMVRNLESESMIKAYVKSSQKQVRKKSIQLGNNFHEYKEIRSYLEGLLKRENCDIECRKGVQNLLNTVGVGSENVRLQFPDLLKGSKRPTLKQISELTHKTPIIYETRLFKEILHELKANLRDYLYTFVKFRKMLLFVEKNLPIQKTKLVRFFNVFRDESIRVNQFPKINEIVRTKANPTEKLVLLKNANASTEYDEFLVTFKRRADVAAQENWDLMLKEAKNTDEEFYLRMLDAEKIAKNKGGLTLNASKGRINKLALVLGSGSFASLYLNFRKTTEVVEEVVVDPLTGESDSDGETPAEVIGETIVEGVTTVITNSTGGGDVSIDDVLNDLRNLKEAENDNENKEIIKDEEVIKSDSIPDPLNIVLAKDLDENLQELELTSADKEEAISEKVVINEDVVQKVIDVEGDVTVINEVHFDGEEVEELYEDIEMINQAVEAFEKSELEQSNNEEVDKKAIQNDLPINTNKPSQGVVEDPINNQ